jgi:hypothetical protein
MTTLRRELWGLAMLAFGTALAVATGCGSTPSEDREHRAAPASKHGGPTGGGDALQAIAAPQAGPAAMGACSGDGWCWSNPMPQGNTVTGMWGTSASDVWAIADTTMLHWNGTAWTGVPLLLTLTSGYKAVWGSGVSDAWVGGAGPAQHWDGASWTIPAGAPTGLDVLWGTAANDVWGFTSLASTAAVHWNGTLWQPVAIAVGGGFASASGSGPNDIWAVGTQSNQNGLGFIEHWNGSSWSFVPPSGDAGVPSYGANFTGVWATGPSDAWVVGSAAFPTTTGAMLHWDGTSWSSTHALTAAQLANNPLVSVGGTGATDVWALSSTGTAFHWNGTTWTSSSTASGMTTLWAASASDVWTAGAVGAMQHYTGTSWASTTTSVTTNQLNSVFGSGSTDVWAVGGIPATATAAGADTILHWTGTAWTDMSVPTTTLTLYGVWSASATDAWAVGQNGVTLHWNGTAWTSVPSATAYDIHGIYGFASDDVWAVGPGGFLLHWDGANWGALPNGYSTGLLYATWGSGTNDVWAVGDSGTILHSDGVTGWTPFNGDTTKNLRAIWGSAKNDVWAVGPDGVATHWNGVGWASVPGFGNGLWGFGPNDMWAVGSGGLGAYDVFSSEGSGIVNWNGLWLDSRSGTSTQAFSAIWGAAYNDIWAVGANGMILHHG